MKGSGKPDDRKGQVRFDVAGAGNGFTVRLVRHRQTKETVTDRLHLRNTAPVLDPTFWQSSTIQSSTGPTPTKTALQMARPAPVGYRFDRVVQSLDRDRRPGNQAANPRLQRGRLSRDVKSCLMVSVVSNVAHTASPHSNLCRGTIESMGILLGDEKRCLPLRVCTRKS